jgi:hypothetical protein
MACITAKTGTVIEDVVKLANPVYLRRRGPFCLSLNAAWSADLFRMTDEMRRSIVRALPKDTRLSSIYNDIIKRSRDTSNHEDGPVTTRGSFRVDLDSKLMYQMGSEGYERLCVPAKLLPVILKVAHDRQAH